MRRDEIISAANILSKSIEQSHIGEAIEATLRHRGSGNRRSQILAAMQRYSIAASSFDEPTRELVKELNLEPLEEPEFWTEILGSEEGPGRPAGFEILQRVNFASENLPALAKLLERDVIESVKSKGPQFEGQEILSVLVIEEEESLSRPERLEKVLSSIRLIYDVCAQLEDLSSQTLSVVALDSGSDKSFDFLGLARVIEQSKEIILSMWDRVVFFREKQATERLQLIAESLPVLEQIEQMKAQGKLAPEKAKILERQVMDGAAQFVEAGATIPEIDSQSQYDPRSLMAPGTKLLAERATESNGSTRSEDGDSENGSSGSSDKDQDTFTRDELERMLGRMRDESGEENSSNDEDAPDEAHGQ